MKIKKLSADATIPTRATPGASCLDLYAATATVIPARGRGLVLTGIAVEVPRGLEMQVRPRSGLAIRYGIVAHLGTIDSDYRGEVGVILFNHSDVDFPVAVGDRIAQAAVCSVVMTEPEIVTELSNTERGAGGFGSTGTR